jgi:glutamine amidotransferase
VIVVIDYGRGNLFSIEQALRHLGADYLVSGDPQDILVADRLILPGVGAFGDAMSTLFKSGLVGPIRQRVCNDGIPVLGICLGMQLFYERSEEFGEHEGLAILKGVVRALPKGDMRIPNVGWRKLKANPRNPFLADIDPETMAYFVHSFAAVPSDNTEIAASIPFNGSDAVIAVARESVIGFQFHPEKSGPEGLGLLQRFLNLPAVNAK